MGKRTLTRRELYDLVCSKSLTRLAAEYSISVYGLRKICIDKKIPFPPIGHWSKLKYGKPSELQELPGDYSGSDEINLEEIPIVNNPDSPFKHLKTEVKWIQESKRLLFSVPKKLANPDSLIVSTKNYFEASKRHSFDRNKPYPQRINVLNIDVTDSSEARAYRIMDTVIKLLRARKHDIKLIYFKTVVIAFDEEVEIRLRERYRILPNKSKWGGSEFEYTGKLVFVIGPNYCKKEIQDGSDLLESKISTILAYIEADAERNRKWRIEAEQREKIRKEKQRIEEEIKHQKEQEAQKFKNLFLNAIRLHQANIIRSYLKTIEETTFANQHLAIEKQEWIQWAKKKVDWYDPLINGEDTILDNDYKESIFKELLKEWQ